jgi:predicted dehydrogenase
VVNLSVIGLETTHGFIYPAMINGYDPAAMQANALDIVSGIFPTGGAPSVDGARIVACYDPDPALARRVADACLIDRVCDDISEAYEGVDGVIIVAGDATSHRQLAIPALNAGLPTFVDKPFTATAEDAEALIELSDRRGAPLFCTSAIRFADQTVALRERLSETVGTPLAAHVIGTGDYTSYAVHSLEFLLSVWGGGVTSLHSLGEAGFDTIKLDYGDHRRAVWQICKAIDWRFHLSIYGTNGMDEASIVFGDRYALFSNTAAQIVRFMASGQSPVPLADTLEIVRLLAAAEHHRGGAPVNVAPTAI